MEMNDQHTHTDHRRDIAMHTDQSNGRGWDFRHYDEPPMWALAVAEVFRPRSLVIIAVMVAVSALWWL